MAIREEKYIDITSGLGGRSQLTRRSLSGRVFTTSPAISNRGIVTFRSPTEVMEYFGVASKEYQFAVKYFGFVSKSMTTPAQLSFAGWGTASEQKSWDKYKAVINSPVSVTVTREADGKESYYLNIQSALEAIGDYAIIDITLNTDLCYIHPYDCEYHDDSDNVFGMGERIYESLMSVTGMDDLNKTEDWKLLNGLTVRKTQTVSFDLNGHIFGGYYHCFVNYGSLSIYDTVGDGRAFTTNLNKYVLTEDGKKIPHSSRREDVVSSKTYTDEALASGEYVTTDGIHITRDTCEAIRNHGECTINGGWYGTAKCTTSPWLNETTWGNAIATYDDSLLTINAGYFTCIPHNAQGPQLAKMSGIDEKYRVLGHLTYASEKNVIKNGGYYAYNSIVNCYSTSRVLVNGGTFFGLFNDIFEVKGGGNMGEYDYGGVVINDGKFYGGFTDEVLVLEKNYSRQSMLQSSAPTKCIKPIVVDPKQTPTQGINLNNTSKPTVSLEGSSVIVVNGGEFYDMVDVSGKDIDTGAEISSPPRRTSQMYSCAMFTGLVSIHNCKTNFDFAREFSYLDMTLNTHFPSEKPIEALRRVDELDDDFGSFCFMELLTPAEAREIAEWNAAKNYKYLYSLPVTDENCKDYLYTVRDLSGTCYTLDKHSAFAEFMPMALFAATKYDRANATKLFMYQRFDSESPSVTNSTDSDLYDAYPADSQGHRFPVNYLGCTMQAGNLISFYQDGYNADGLDTACYCNEVWLKDAISVEILNTFLAIEKIPSNHVGEAVVKNAITTVLNEAIENGTIILAKNLSNVQKVTTDRLANTQGAWEAVVDYGYWLGVTIKQRVVASGRTQFYADYVLIYSKGDAIRKVEASDIMI